MLTLTLACFKNGLCQERYFCKDTILYSDSIKFLTFNDSPNKDNVLIYKDSMLTIFTDYSLVRALLMDLDITNNSKYERDFLCSLIFISISLKSICSC